MLDRALLPPAEVFFRKELSRLSRPSRGWANARCVFPGHDDRTPSLSVNVREGNFLCHGCGIKGGDVIAFVRQRYGLSFREACEELGAWTDGTVKSRRDLARRQRERQRLDSARENLKLEERRLRFGLRDYLHNLDRIEQEVCHRLSSNPQEDLYWRVLSLIPEERREAVAGYMLLSFASAIERCRFVLNEEARPGMIDAVLTTGGVRDDAGRFVEVGL